ncbi:MAG: hypothetical protein HYR63_21625 [Proteobacteria bacterium]|nr:hypothetical protein [Pseudomonadota bacterium]
MSITGITSGTSSVSNPFLQSLQDELQQRLANFKALQEAVKSGDLAGAKKAFAALQKSAQLGGQDPNGQLFGPNDQLNNDFKALGDALDAGNLPDAKKAFAKLQQDMIAARKSGHHHHRNHDSAAMTVTVSETITISTSEQAPSFGSSNDNDSTSGDADPAGGGNTGVLNILA